MIRKLSMVWGLTFISFLYSMNAMAMPGTATATALNDTTIKITLSASATSGPQFPIQVQTFRNGASLGTHSHPFGTLMFNETNLAGGTYVFFIEWCVATTSGECVEATDTTDPVTIAGPPLPPPPPAAVQCSNCNEPGPPYRDYDGTYLITWSSVSGATSYEIEQAVHDGSNFGSFSDIASGSVSNNPTGLYRYHVRACNANGCSTTWRDIDKDVEVLGPPTPPPTASASHDFATITVNWGAPVGGGPVSHYEITDLQPDGSGGTASQAGRTKTYPVSDLGLYSYAVRACNAAGCSTPSTNAAVDVQLTNCNVSTGTYAVQACTASRRDDKGTSVTRSGGPAEAAFAIALADGLYDIGAAFLCEANADVHQLGLLNRNAPDAFDSLINENGDPTFDADALTAAEGYYGCALSADPGNTNALEGILRIKRALVEKQNLVSDIRRKDQFVSRFEVTAPGPGSQTLLVTQEINLLQAASAELRDAIATILALYAEPGTDGAGAILRGEVVLFDSAATQDTIRGLLATISRFAKVEQDLGRARIDLEFYDENVSNGRPAVLDDLDDAAAYLTTVLQLLNPFINETTFDLPEPNEPVSSTDELLNRSSLLEVNQGLDKLDELSSLLRQGYNPFGFVPDFVPFVHSAAHENNLHNFYQMQNLALSAISDLQSREATICGACNGIPGGLLNEIRNFATSESEYQIRLNAITTTYQQRLKTLVGDVTLPGGVDKVADIYTFLYPDQDLDEDGITERDEYRAELTAQGFNFLPVDKGEIAAQYLIIANAETRADDVLDQMNDLVERMELIEAEAHELADLDVSVAEHIFERVTADGDRISLLIKQRGYIIQAAADREARKRKRRGLFSSIANLAAGIAASISTGNPGFAINAASNVRTAIAASSTSGSASGQAGVIDAQINDIRTLQQADIIIVEAVGDAESRLIKAGYSMYNLALSQNNLALSYVVAQRDIDRELNALARQSAEVSTLLSDLERTEALLLQNSNNLTIGWADVGVRDTLTDSILVADQALLRAKVWSYVALRALDYYGNPPPNPSTGQPASIILDLYQRLYFARRSEELEYIATRMEELATTDFLFTEGTVSCGVKTLLSLKYDIFTTNSIEYDPVTGDVVDNSDTGLFEYFSTVDGMTYAGTDAYQALFRDQISRGLSGPPGNRRLEIRFGTNLFPPPPETPGFEATNPYFLLDAKDSKIIGFENSNCQGVGIPNNAQGIQMDFRSSNFGTVDPPSIWLFQEGNGYLKHTGWDASDFNAAGRLIDPMKNLTVFTAYEQILPTWLIGDIGTSIVPEDRIGSAVNDTIFPLINGQNGGGGTKKTLAFSDRPVANDSWRIVIRELDSNNDEFFDAFQLMLDSPVGSVNGQFLKDIHLSIGWASRNN